MIGVEIVEAEAAEVLSDVLDELNRSGCDGVTVYVHGSVWLAYCTDPDGAWFFESGDPEERMAKDANGWREYSRVGFAWLGPIVDAHGAYVLKPFAIWEAAA